MDRVMETMFGILNTVMLVLFAALLTSYDLEKERYIERQHQVMRACR